MIDVYTWTTGNSRKIPIFLEEAEVPYRMHMVNIRTGEQFLPDFVKICPNSKVPAIVDQDGPGGKPLSLFESGAILIYLGDKYGKFIGKDAAGRYRAIEWVMFQMANIGPLFGQANHFLNKTPEKIPYAIDRYAKEAARLTKVLEKRLGEVEYLAGDYSIADMATYVWLRNPKNEGISLDDYPNVKRWFNAIDTRPAVQRAHKAVDAAGAAYLEMKKAG
ncbi:MAG: GSH-dependent disulfide-bond oxidoreductase [Alphaproteobacteria bacterium]|nr:GSH-dependent disulfide-bond oxidoreductase [Alphaproteobacteria bacterium]